MPVIRIETRIAAPPRLCFDLARDVDAHMASTSSSGERAVAGVTHGRLNLGDEVTWEARHLGRRQRLSSRITEFASPHHFVDEMVHGAFARFRHEHVFHSRDGETVMVDLFDYTSPLGLLGRVADMLFLRRYMEKLLRERALFLRARAEASTQVTAGPAKSR
jgi:ligand-binding SRPBCC domain-containing protein